MMNSNVTRKAFCLLALTLAAFAAEPAGATGRHHHPGRYRLHTKRLAKASPTQIPILDCDLNRPAVTTQYAMQQINLAQAQTVSHGAGVVVALLDGGFDLTHEALAGHIVAGDVDLLDGDGDAQDLGNGIDDDLDGNTDWLVGHGTFVASLVLAIAPDANILPIRVLDDEGWGTDQSVTDGVNYAVAHGAKVINMSLVVPNASSALRTALRAAADAGCVVVGAAGNEPGVWYDDPNLASRVLAVGAVDSADTLLSWSVTGALVDVYAPGENISGALGGAVSNSYAHWSGTSFSAPMASGGAALLLSHTPAMTPLDVCNKLRDTADPAIGVTPWYRGRLNLGRALTQ